MVQNYLMVSVYNISYKTQTGPKPLHIMINKMDGFIMALDGNNKHLILFDILNILILL